MGFAAIFPMTFWFGPLVLPDFPAGSGASPLALVAKLGSRDFKERNDAQSQLTQRGDAVWAVLWGSQHREFEISRRCKAILTEWRTLEAEPWRHFVHAADGQFDHFLNEILLSRVSSYQDMDIVIRLTRSFDRFVQSHSFPTFAADTSALPTPFDLHRHFARAKTTVFPVRLQSDHRLDHSAYRCEKATFEQVRNSILICDGNVTVRACARSLMISGGDVRISGGVGNSMVFAAGNVAIGSIELAASGSENTLVVSGGRRAASATYW